MAPHESSRPLIELVVVIPARRARKAMPRKRAKRRRETRERSPEFLAFVHTMPRWCERTLPGHRCRRGELGGVGEADHVGARGTSQKSHDRETVHLCKTIHKARDTFVGAEWREGGVFYDAERGAAWTRGQMKAWLAEGTDWYQAEFAKHRRRQLDEIPF